MWVIVVCVCLCVFVCVRACPRVCAVCVLGVVAVWLCVCVVFGMVGVVMLGVRVVVCCGWCVGCVVCVVCVLCQVRVGCLCHAR